MPTDLNIPILEYGLRRIPFFNGRVLTAEDLETEQKANATERKRTGRALGTGVLEGLFVSRGSGNPPTTVTVEQGLALAPSGRVVELPKKTTVSVVSEAEGEETAGTKGLFDDCSTEHATVRSGTGAYVLFVEPASGTEGRTPRTTIGGDGTAGTCGAQYRLEGARLCLASLDVTSFSSKPLREAIQQRAEAVSTGEQSGDGPSPEDVSRLRNLLAHACLGTPTAAGGSASLEDAFRGRKRQDVQYGPVDALRQNTSLSGDAVPIGLLYWLRNRVEFVDVWSVRRRVHPPDAHTPVPATDRRRAETEAAVFQFHEQLDALQDQGHQIPQIPAKRFFAYLPPVGIVGGGEALPVFRRLTLPSLSPRFTIPGIDKLPGEAELPPVPLFFEGVTKTKPSIVEPQRLRALTDEALQYPSLPLDPTLPPDPGSKGESGPLVWLYVLAPDAPGEEVEPPFLFTTGYAPFFGDAQYNVSRINRATYSSTRGPPNGS